MSEGIIGIFDSGLGGLSIMKAVREKLPLEDILYVGDCEHAPYGEKSDAFITDRVRKICHFFLDNNAKTVVIACNTATAASIDTIRKEMPIPFIGVEPGVKPAIAMTKTKSVGVLATASTVASSRYKKLLNRYNPDGSVSVISSGCSGLMECVEKGAWDSIETAKLIHSYVAPMEQAKVDVVVLGCTHYPFLKKAIQDEVGPKVYLYDPSPAVAEEVKRQLDKRDQLKKDGPQGTEKFFISGLNEETSRIFRRLWNSDCPQVAPFTL